MRTHIFATAAALLPSALAWGAAGHEIVATIAQIHLHPEVKEALCAVLPKQANCHLAPIAAWADTVRRYYPETAPMHYVNPREDHPGAHCTYGEHGWINEDVNVLTAIVNKTHAVADGEGDIALRFLVHFLGDLHQPLHLTGRERGGNGAIFKFEGRTRSLHSVWDSGIITKNIRELSNYTSPLPSKQIEDSLPGAIFDPYVRWIVWEGIRQWWPSDLEEWLSCPADGDPYPHSSLGDVPPSPKRPEWMDTALDYVSGAASYLPSYLSYLPNVFLPASTHRTEGTRDALLANHPQRLATRGETNTEPACPYTWSQRTHAINCDYAWPKEYNVTAAAAGVQPPIELDTPEYLGRIRDDHVVERLLAQGGLRLAKILNEVFGKGNVSSLYVGY